MVSRERGARRSCRPKASKRTDQGAGRAARARNFDNAAREDRKGGTNRMANPAADEPKASAARCWDCGEAAQPHPRRDETIEFQDRNIARPKRHPFPEASFACPGCSTPEESMDLLQCAECNEMSVDWFYDLGILNEDMWACSACKSIYCEPCYLDRGHPKHAKDI